MSTILELSKHANIPESIVLKVLNNDKSVSDSDRLVVEKSIILLGEDKKDNEMKNKDSNLVGVIIGSVSSPYFSKILAGIEEVLSLERKEMVVVNSFGKSINQIKSLEKLLDHCMGLIIYNETQIHDIVFSQFKIPFVTIGANPALENTINIRVKNRIGGYLAAKNLIENGHTQIVHLAGWKMHTDARERLAGFWQAIDEAGIDRDLCLVVEGAYNERFGFNAIQKIVADGFKFTAVCAGDDDIAAGVYSAFSQLQISIPDDISVIGYDDNFHAKYMTPPLSTVHQPLTKMGSLAASKLLESVDKKTMIKSFELEPLLIKRGSVADKNLPK
jgi:LacI family transcriptional regulator